MDIFILLVQCLLKKKKMTQLSKVVSKNDLKRQSETSVKYKILIHT